MKKNVTLIFKHFCMQREAIDIKTNSTGQAIQIPEEFRIDDDKVYLKKTGNIIHIIPYHKPWQNLFDSLSEFTPDFMNERNQSTQQTRESLD
jgi:antitoxin VapB